MILSRHNHLRLSLFLLVVAICSFAQAESPLLNSVYPPGGQVGTAFEATILGNNLIGLSSLRCSQSGITFKKLDQSRFKIEIPADTPPGLYDLQAVCENGISSTRTFFVTGRHHLQENATPDSSTTLQQVALESVISGHIEKPGEFDQYQFSAKQGQRVVLECWAERIDSQLRAVLELYDLQGKRLASNRGFFGVDPAFCLTIPADGEYVVRVSDLIYSGSSNHFYRLDVSAGPRVVCAVPAIVQQGIKTTVTLYGWNLNPKANSLSQHNAPQSNTTTAKAAKLSTSSLRTSSDIETQLVQITAPKKSSISPVHLAPEQIALTGFTYSFPGADIPIQLGLSELTVVGEQEVNNSVATAQAIDIPCQVAGQLIHGDENDWYSIQARRGEVLYLEAFGQRLGSPVDLDIRIMSADGEDELASFHDELANIGGLRFPSNHVDPAGRWVSPADGKYLIVIRNLIGDLKEDPRRLYQLSLRREDPDAQLVAIAGRPNSPATINLSRGGREMFDLLAFRRRGMNGSIRVSAIDLPAGVSCPDIWLGPGVNRAAMILSADENAPPFVGSLDLVASVNRSGAEISHKVRGGTMIRTGLPNGAGRLTADIAWSVSGESPVLATATCERNRFSQGSIVDININLQRRNIEHQATLKLSGVGLPELVRNQIVNLDAGQNKGIISFYLPPTLPIGRYSIVVQADTTVLESSGEKPQAVSVSAFTNPISFDVHAAPFTLKVDLDAPRKIKRGQYIRLGYTAKRKNGFIGKIHTTLETTDSENGLRARGVTFVNQVESGILQIIANDDAPLGRLTSIRLEAVGTVEDKPVYLGSCFLDLEIVD